MSARTRFPWFVEKLDVVKAVEEAFGVQVPDHAFEALHTVGDLFQFVVTHRLPRGNAVCLSGAVFNRIRQGMASALKTPRTQVRPKAELKALLPATGRRIAWKRLQDASGLRLPDLLPPEWLLRCLLVVAVATPVPVALAWFAGKADMAQGLAMMAVSVAIPFIVFVWGAVLLLSPRSPATEPGAGCATVAGLTRKVLALNYGTLALENDRWDDEQVWDDLCRLIEGWEVSRERVTRNARLVEDLGVSGG